MSDADRDWIERRREKLKNAQGNPSFFNVPGFEYEPEDQDIFSWGTNGKYSSKLIVGNGMYMAKMTLGSDVANKN